MKTIYIDNECKCHVTNDGTMTAVETDFFDGKCDEYIEGYRFVPEGEELEMEDGSCFYGEMIAPWKNDRELERAQSAYERQIMTEYAEALRTMGVSV